MKNLLMGAMILGALITGPAANASTDCLTGKEVKLLRLDKELREAFKKGNCEQLAEGTDFGRLLDLKNQEIEDKVKKIEAQRVERVKKINDAADKRIAKLRAK